MPLQSYVIPLPQLRVGHLLQFDFPADYHSTGAVPNSKTEPPAIEEMYAKLGTPAKDQAHPAILEHRPGTEDSRNAAHQFQTLDIDLKIQICHTGRLSGNFVKYIAKSPYHSIVEIFAVPIAPSIGNPIPLYHEERKLEARNDGANAWHWKDPAERMELIYTAQAIIDPRDKGLQPEQIYKLVSKWGFWDYSGVSKERMSISGFDEAVTFEVIEKTRTR
jgi:hypothetical protein